MKVPNIEQAAMPQRKLRDYLLSDLHPVGRYKAAFFKAAGYSQDRALELESALVSILSNDVVDIVKSEFGTKYIVPGVLAVPQGGERNIVTVWIILSGEEAPRFVTAYPEGNRND